MYLKKVPCKKKILLVEDEAPLAMHEVGILEKHGFEVIVVYSGEKAVEKVGSEPNLSLILMDLNLEEGMNRVETAKIILKEHDLAIVFLTSHPETATAW